ncbi:Qin prophage protein [Escherichia fergusonii]|nr:Qin prophage protein [Escherichia fergusonii]
MQHPHAAENYCRTFTPVNKLYFLRRASPRGKQSEHQTINDTRNTIKDFFVHADSAFLKGEIYVCHNSGEYLNRYFKQLRPEGTSEIAKITRQIQVLTEKLGKISSEEGMTTQQKKEMAALVQKQIESLRAQLEQLLRQQAEKKNKDATVQPDKKEEKKDDTNTAGTIDIYV